MPANPFYDRDIVSIRDFTKNDLEFIFAETDKLSRLKPSQRGELGKGRTLGYIFYEPSTRTRMSTPTTRTHIRAFTSVTPHSGSRSKGHVMQ